MSMSSFNQPPISAAASGIEELEAQRTIGLTRVVPADPAPEPLIEEAMPAAEPMTNYEVTIASMANGLDGGRGVIEGTVEITEHVNETYVSSVTVTSSVVVEPDTPMSLVEDRLLNSAREAIGRLAALSGMDLRGYMENTKKDNDQAY